MSITLATLFMEHVRRWHGSQSTVSIRIAICDASGVHTTVQTPIFHRPKDECGGGSAWAAGLIDSLGEYFGDIQSVDAVGSADSDLYDSPLVRCARRADLLAGTYFFCGIGYYRPSQCGQRFLTLLGLYEALCQETVGDLSQVRRSKLATLEMTYAVSCCVPCACLKRRKTCNKFSDF